MGILEHIREYMHEKELLMSLLLTMIFLFLSFIGHTRLTTVTITDKLGESHEVHASNYGFPFEIITIFTPFGDESYWIEQSGGGSIRILWGGFLPDFVIYFLLSFVIVYISRRLTRS